MWIDPMAQAAIDKMVAAGHELPMSPDGLVTWECETVDDDGELDGGGHEMVSCSLCSSSWCIWCVESGTEEIDPCVGAAPAETI